MFLYLNALSVVHTKLKVLPTYTSCVFSRCCPMHPHYFPMVAIRRLPCRPAQQGPSRPAAPGVFGHCQLEDAERSPAKAKDQEANDFVLRKSFKKTWEMDGNGTSGYRLMDGLADRSNRIKLNVNLNLNITEQNRLH